MMENAFRWQCGAYDGLYIDLAQRLGCPVATVDRGMRQGQERARWWLAIADRGGIRPSHDHALLGRKLALWAGCRRGTTSIRALGQDRWRLDTRKN